MASFEAVADEYDAARPSYPDEVFDALGPLAGLCVLDVGAGTGIATRALIARHAAVIAIDHGREVLWRARSHTHDLIAVVADGTALPIGSNAVDLVCFAQAWHWLNPPTRVAEIHRVLRPGGRWAGWWSHARADGEQWFRLGARSPPHRTPTGRAVQVPRSNHGRPVRNVALGRNTNLNNLHWPRTATRR